MHKMFELANQCPYTKICESHQAMCRSESWMEKAFIRMVREGSLVFSTGDEGLSYNVLQSKLDHIRNVKDRCFFNYNRCLRFRQYKARDEKGEQIQPRLVLHSAPDEETIIDVRNE